MTVVKQLLAEIKLSDKKLDIPFEKSWFKEGIVSYPLNFTVKTKANVNIYGYYDENNKVKYAFEPIFTSDETSNYQLTGYDNMNSLFMEVKKVLNDHYGIIDKLEVKNPSIIKTSAKDNKTPLTNNKWKKVTNPDTVKTFKEIVHWKEVMPNQYGGKIKNKKTNQEYELLYDKSTKEMFVLEL